MSALPPTAYLQCEQQRLRYLVAGDVGPSIVLISGTGQPLEGWRGLFPAILDLGRVLAWDRPGCGGSPAPRQIQTGLQVCQQLHGLLQTLALPPPWLLVAHSFGGLHANLFARLHAAEVAGLLLLDATAPAALHSMARPGRRARSLRQFFQRFCARQPWAETRHAWQTLQQLEQAADFPPLPLTVITGAHRPPLHMLAAASAEQHMLHQHTLCRLSPHGRHVLAEHSGHFPHRSQPGLVVQEIAALLARAELA